MTSSLPAPRLLPVPRLLFALAQAALLAVLPDGGQARARRNADLAVRDAHARAAATARGTGATGR